MIPWQRYAWKLLKRCQHIFLASDWEQICLGHHAHGLMNQFRSPGRVYPGEEGMSAGVLGNCILSQEAEGHECWCSASFLFLMQSWITAQEMVPPTFSMGLPTPHFWRLASLVIIEPVKFVTLSITKRINGHKPKIRLDPQNKMKWRHARKAMPRVQINSINACKICDLLKKWPSGVDLHCSVRIQHDNPKRKVIPGPPSSTQTDRLLFIAGP